MHTVCRGIKVNCSSLDVDDSGLTEHDRHVGEPLKLLEDLKIADNLTVV
ncbi:MAG: hypothetical protein ING61_16315 [Rhodocyclaceae bacterium]|nr:hypothetical protein [Rhodocyclaceae bacterium]MCA3065009.1 hypothetical protein [Rhodocyclaceae bacterium]